MSDDAEVAGIIAAANTLRDRAEAGPIGKRHSSFELYALLADCMALADRCREPAEYETLRMALVMQGGSGNRRFIERQSDEYQLVCRYVFFDRNMKREHGNANRYAAALREAARHQIRSADLNEHLRTKGGVNALFLTRPLTAMSSTLKTLYLAEAVTVPKAGRFTLTLERRSDGAFLVHSNGAPS